MEFVEEVGLSALVDMIVCGDDQVKNWENISSKVHFLYFKVSKSKPDPHNLLYICDKLGISVDKAVMVSLSMMIMTMMLVIMLMVISKIGPK